MIIRGGKVALPDREELCEVEVRVQDGRISAIGTCLDAGKGEEILDARNLIVLPGGIDPHVHFDEPGYTEREDFFHGSCAAASGGVTTVIDMPCTSVPPVTDLSNFQKKLEVIERKSVVDFGLFGGVCAQSFEKGFPRNMEELSRVVLGFKTYFVSGMESFARLNHYQFREVLGRAAELGLPVLLHAEDFDFVRAATEREMKEGSSPLHYYRSRPETAEALAVLAAVHLAEEKGADLHIVHIGTAQAVEHLAGRRLPESRSRGEGITGETGPHYLAFDLGDFERLGPVLKCTPPVKAPGNKERLWQLLAQGAIHFVASDHAPCRPEEKRTGSIWTDYGGIPGCGTLLPYMFSEGFMKGRLTLRCLVQVVSENAARRYGLFKRKGSIEVGKDADFALIDPAGHWTVRGSAFYSKGKETPFEGMHLNGRVVRTILRGKVVYTAEEGVVATAGGGKLLRRAV